MHVSVEKKGLVDALNHVRGVVEKRSTIPILGNVKIVADEGRMVITATDMDIVVTEIVQGVSVHEGGALTAPAHTLHDIVKKVGDTDIELRLDAEANKLICKAGRSRFSLACLPVDDFPSMADDDMNVSFDLPVADLRELFDRTKFAMSSEETRYYLNGVYLQPAQRDGTPVLRAVATDGHRLALAEAPLPDGAADMPGLIIPRKTVNEAGKLLTGDGRCSVHASDSKISITVGEADSQTHILSKVVDGTFPDYQRVIPEGNEKRLTVDRRVFVSAVDRVSAVNTGKSRAIKVGLGSGKMALTANGETGDSAVEDMEVEYVGTDMEIGFNAGYMADVMGQIGGAMADIALHDGNSPVLIRDPANGSSMFVLMPMRV